MLRLSCCANSRAASPFAAESTDSRALESSVTDSFRRASASSTPARSLPRKDSDAVLRLLRRNNLLLNERQIDFERAALSISLSTKCTRRCSPLRKPLPA